MAFSLSNYFQHEIQTRTSLILRSAKYQPAMKLIPRLEAIRAKKSLFPQGASHTDMCHLPVPASSTEPVQLDCLHFPQSGPTGECKIMRATTHPTDDGSV